MAEQLLLNDATEERNNNQMNNNDGERLVTQPPAEPTSFRPPARVIKRLSPEDRCVAVHRASMLAAAAAFFAAASSRLCPYRESTIGCS